ncbi:MAG TPA: proteasome accessory factor PafA2 family protein [Armatimonadota bacterium]|nr:proteasome accessory factor PafA2 family protein [Armatimonadota bacterium]
MHERIFGLETEFGCLVNDDSVGGAEEIVERVKDYVFREQNLGVIDLHCRDAAFEPSGAGGFLCNGGRLYIDVVGSHEEYATAECRSIADLIAHEKAGQRILQNALEEMGLASVVGFYNNSVDHFGGHTFGCHENYLIDGEHFQRDAIDTLLPFLVTRQIFAGVGRVGGHKINRHSLDKNVMQIGDFEEDYLWISNFYGVEIDDSVDYQLSQRADHIVKTVSSRVRFNRAIINPKWDHHYNFSNYHRLHVLYGEGNMSEYATMLKIGTTCLALELTEAGLAPSLALLDPLGSLRSISRDGSLQWPVRMEKGGMMRAVDVQRAFLAAAKRHLSGQDNETDGVIAAWEETLNALESDPMSLADRLDWVAKKKLLQSYMDTEGGTWHDDIMFSLDMEYHNVSRADGLFYGLQDAGEIRRATTDDHIERSMSHAPVNTRAAGREMIVRRLTGLNSTRNRYVVDWDGVYFGRDHRLEMTDPFHTYRKEASSFVRSL